MYQGRLNKLDQATAKYPIKEQVTFQSNKLFKKLIHNSIKAGQTIHLLENEKSQICPSPTHSKEHQTKKQRKSTPKKPKNITL